MKPRPRHIRPPTPETLSKAALIYLGRFAASEEALRRVLENRIRRAAMHNSEFGQDHDAQAELRRAIENIIEKHRKTGVLNDAIYAETKINSLRRVGRSARAITQRLGRAGVKNHIIADALERSEDRSDPDAEDAEIRAARELARRRKLGPFRVASRSGAVDPMQRQKDLAVLARAGFTLDTARRVLGKTSSGDQYFGDRNDEDVDG